MQTILFLGDSLTAGYGLSRPSQESMPALIQQKINAAGINAKIINAGISGDTSAGGLARIDRLIEHPIDIFVLELGVNDALRGISPQTTIKNLQGIVNKVKNKYPPIKLVLIGMEIPEFIHGPFAEEFRHIFRQLAAMNNMAFVPFMLKNVAGKKHLNLPDRLHPNAEGYKLITENVWPVLCNLLIKS